MQEIYQRIKFLFDKKRKEFKEEKLDVSNVLEIERKSGFFRVSLRNIFKESLKNNIIDVYPQKIEYKAGAIVLDDIKKMCFTPDLEEQFQVLQKFEKEAALVQEMKEAMSPDDVAADISSEDEWREVDESDFGVESDEEEAGVVAAAAASKLQQTENVKQ